MAKKLSEKQLTNIKKFRKNNPKKETTHQRRTRIKRDQAWWISRD